jgi:hypothetical protein
MIQAAVRSSPLDGIRRTRLFYHQDSRLVPLGIETKLAEFPLGDVPALSAKREPVFDGTNRLCQAERVFALGLQDMERQSLRRLLADAWKTD